ncbi:MAG: hypothetical protein AAF267_23305 [Deinococcota bacterium]
MFLQTFESPPDVEVRVFQVVGIIGIELQYREIQSTKTPSLIARKYDKPCKTFNMKMNTGYMVLKGRTVERYYAQQPKDFEENLTLNDLIMFINDDMTEEQKSDYMKTRTIWLWPYV